MRPLFSFGTNYNLDAQLTSTLRSERPAGTCHRWLSYTNCSERFARASGELGVSDSGTIRFRPRQIGLENCRCNRRRIDARSAPSPAKRWRWLDNWDRRYRTCHRSPLLRSTSWQWAFCSASDDGCRDALADSRLGSFAKSNKSYLMQSKWVSWKHLRPHNFSGNSRASDSWMPENECEVCY